ncbi:MAG: nucleotidyltransferase domain-containing protein [Anaerolineales bacterium]
MLDLKVPNVNERDRVPEEAIRAVVDHIARNFDPDKIILFGSYGYGDPKPWSDVDLLVVMDTDTLEGEMPLMLAIYRSLSPLPFGMDILVRSQATIDYRIPLGDWFLKEITELGKVMYERRHR